MYFKKYVAYLMTIENLKVRGIEFDALVKFCVKQGLSLENVES